MAFEFAVYENDPNMVVHEGCKCLSLTARGNPIVVFPDRHSEVIPQSQIHDDSEVYAAGTEGVLIIPIWLATKRGWYQQ